MESADGVTFIEIDTILSFLQIPLTVFLRLGFLVQTEINIQYKGSSFYTEFFGKRCFNTFSNNIRVVNVIIGKNIKNDFIGSIFGIWTSKNIPGKFSFYTLTGVVAGTEAA